jgi:flagellar basal-body rod modification protein FlgD
VSVAIDAITGSDSSADPAGPASAAARGEALDRDAFLRLLLVQLQHQDPTSPQSNEEFLAQLAQFSTLEQLTSINKAVSEMAHSLSALADGLQQPAEDQPAVEGT